MKKSIVILFYLIIAIIGKARESQWVIVEGSAAIFLDDIDAAKNAAIYDALEKALEKYAGLYIDSYSIYSKALLLDSVFKANLFGYIEKYELLESSCSDKKCVVKIKALVGEKPVFKTLEDLAAHQSVLILLWEKSLNQPIEGMILPTILAQPFFSGKVFIPTNEEITKSKIIKNLSFSFYENPDLNTILELGRRFLCDLVIIGWANTEDATPTSDSVGYEVDPSVLYPIAYAKGNLFIYSISEKKNLASFRFDKIKGADNKDINRASLQSLEFLGKEMVTKIVKILSDYLKEKKHVFYIKTTLTDELMQKLINSLKIIRFVKDVEIYKKEEKEIVLKIVFSERSRYFYLLLKTTPDIIIKSYDQESKTFVVSLKD